MGNVSLNIKRLVDDRFDGNVSKFAAKVGISETNVRNYIAGRLPKLDILEQIVDSFELSYDDLIKGDLISNKKKSSYDTEIDEMQCIYESVNHPHVNINENDALLRLIALIEKKDDQIFQLNKEIRSVLEENTQLREKIAGLLTDIQHLKETSVVQDAGIGHSAAG